MLPSFAAQAAVFFASGQTLLAASAKTPSEDVLAVLETSVPGRVSLILNTLGDVLASEGLCAASCSASLRNDFTIDMNAVPSSFKCNKRALDCPDSSTSKEPRSAQVCSPRGNHQSALQPIILPADDSPTPVHAPDSPVAQLESPETDLFMPSPDFNLLESASPPNASPIAPQSLGTETMHNARIVDIAFPLRPHYDAENERCLQRSVCARLMQDAARATDHTARSVALAQLAHALECVLASGDTSEAAAWARGVSVCAQGGAVLAEAVEIAVARRLDGHVLALIDGGSAPGSCVEAVIGAALAHGVSANGEQISKGALVHPHMRRVSLESQGNDASQAASTPHADAPSHDSTIPPGIRAALSWLQIHSAHTRGAMTAAMARLGEAHTLALVRAAARFSLPVRAAALEACAYRGCFLRSERLVAMWASGIIHPECRATSGPASCVAGDFASWAVHSGWPIGAAMIVKHAATLAVRVTAITSAVNAAISTGDLRTIFELYDVCAGDSACLAALNGPFVSRNVWIDCAGRLRFEYKKDIAEVLIPAPGRPLGATSMLSTGIPSEVQSAVLSDSAADIVMAVQTIKAPDTALTRAIWLADRLGSHAALRAIVFTQRPLDASSSKVRACAADIVASDLLHNVERPFPWLFASESARGDRIAIEIFAEGVIAAFRRGAVAMNGALRAIHMHGGNVCDGITSAYAQACVELVLCDTASSKRQSPMCKQLDILLRTCRARTLTAQ